MLQKSPGGSSIAATPVPMRFFKWISLYNSLRSQGCLVTRSTPCPLFPLVPQIPISSSSPCMWPCVPQPLGFWCHRCHRGYKGPQPLAGTASLERPPWSSGHTPLLLWAISSRTTDSRSSGCRLAPIPWGKALPSQPARCENLGGSCSTSAGRQVLWSPSSCLQSAHLFVITGFAWTMTVKRARGLFYANSAHQLSALGARLCTRCFTQFLFGGTGHVYRHFG